MAESNQVTLNKATIPGGEVAATDTIASKQYQLIKLILGAAGVNSGPVSAANPLPTGDAAAAAALASILAKLSADPATQTTLAAVLAKITADPATQTTLAAVLAKLTADPATAAGVTAAGGAVVAQLVANLAGTQPVSAAALPLPSGAASEVTLALIQAVLSAWTFSGGAGLVIRPTDVTGTGVMDSFDDLSTTTVEIDLSANPVAVFSGQWWANTGETIRRAYLVYNADNLADANAKLAVPSTRMEISIGAVGGPAAGFSLAADSLLPADLIQNVYLQAASAKAGSGNHFAWTGVAP
jgi:hypothetical protein